MLSQRAEQAKQLETQRNEQCWFSFHAGEKAELTGFRMSLDEGQFGNRIRKDSKKGNKNIMCTYKAAAFPRKMGHEGGSIKVSLSDELGKR